MPTLGRRISDWLDEPVLVLRLEIVRIVAPLAILGFMSTRLVHADEWIGTAGFRVPDLGGDWRQPLFIPALPDWLAWTIAGAMVMSGVACSAGWRARPAAAVLAATLAFVALSDRLAAFTVSKLSPTIMLAVALGPAGTTLGIDAWLRGRAAKPRNGKSAEGADGDPPGAPRPIGSVRFLQVLPVVIYSASGIAKARGDWLRHPLVLWTHLHDTYQTYITFALASVLPGWLWTTFQAMVLAFEVLAPLWFGWSRTRTWALVFGVGMHAMIGLMFGPVLWFALLMMTLLVAGYLPDRFLVELARRAARTP